MRTSSTSNKHQFCIHLCFFFTFYVNIILISFDWILDLFSSLLYSQFLLFLSIKCMYIFLMNHIYIYVWAWKKWKGLPIKKNYKFRPNLAWVEVDLVKARSGLAWLETINKNSRSSFHISQFAQSHSKLVCTPNLA